MNIIKFVKHISLLIIITLVSACSIIEVKTKITYEGKDRQIPENIINAAMSGKTDKAWLIDHIGYPDQILKKGSSREHYIYKYSENRETYIGVLLLYSNEYTEKVNTDVVFELENNVVQNYWSKEVAPKWDSPQKKLTDEEVLVIDQSDKKMPAPSKSRRTMKK